MHLHKKLLKLKFNYAFNLILFNILTIFTSAIDFLLPIFNDSIYVLISNNFEELFIPK